MQAQSRTSPPEAGPGSTRALRRHFITTTREPMVLTAIAQDDGKLIVDGSSNGRRTARSDPYGWFLERTCHWMLDYRQHQGRTEE
jgi:hypothetical protein